MSRNGLCRAYSQLGERDTNPLIIQTKATITSNCGKALKGRYMMLLTACNRRTALFRSPRRSGGEVEGEEHFRESEL